MRGGATRNRVLCLIARAFRVLALGVFSLAAAGCGKILGVDEYGVGAPSPPVVTCADPLTAPNASGACEKVGPDCLAPSFLPDPDGGCMAKLPAADCKSVAQSPMGAFPGQVDCGSESLFGICETDPPQSRGEFPAPYYYVDPAAAPRGTGDPAHPFASIKDALAAMPAPQSILLHSGTYRENIDVNIPVRIQGVCPGVTHLVGLDPSKPTVHFGPDADGASMGLLDVSGDASSTGIAMEGVSGARRTGYEISVSAGGEYLHLVDVWVHDVRQGIMIDDSGQTNPVMLRQVLLERIGEHGITIRGSSVTLEQALLRDVGTPSLSPAIESAALDVHPSRRAPHSEAITGQIWDPWHSTRSNVTLSDSLVERATTGLLLEGSEVNVATTEIRDTTTGVVARWRPLGPVPGDVSIDHSVIEGSAEVGVQVWNARATITNTTIRNTGSDCPASDAARPAGAYPGNAVRARFDRVPGEPTDGGSTFDPASQALTVSHSLLDGSRQAGFHVEGGALTLDHTLVRATSVESCTGKLGDGVMVYSHAGFPPATVSLHTARISGSAGPGLAAFGTFAAPFSFAGVILDGSGAITRDSPEIGIVGDPQCVDGSVVKRCAAVDGEPTRSVAVAHCAPGASELDCLTVCFENLAVPGTLPSAPLVAEFLREPSLAPAIADTNGCTAIGGLEANRLYEGAALSDVFVPAQSPFSVSGTGPATTPRARVELVNYSYQGYAEALSFGPGPHGQDLATGLGASVYLCQGRAAPPPDQAPVPLPEVCPTGLQDWAPEIVQAPSGTLGPFPSNEQLAPGLVLASDARVGGLWYYYNVAPGDRELRLVPRTAADGTTGTLSNPPQCSPSFFSDLYRNGAEYTSGPAASWTDLRLRVEAGYLSTGGYLYCTQ